MLRGRLAPSPTGRLHLGNARTALLAWLAIRSQGGELVLRIEDVDRGRCRPEYEAALIADLRWLGLDWDEGPDVGGPQASYRQSERAAHYERALAQLATYPCSCTRASLRAAQPRSGDAGVIYPGHCRSGLTRPDGATALRWRVPDETVGYTDPIQGRIEQHLGRDVGDLVLRRRDGYWAYLLAVVVDDAAMGINHVLRGADLWTSTPQQIALHRALGQVPPGFAHVPLLLDPEGSKLSKRRRSPAIEELRSAGVSPDRVVGELAASIGLFAGPAGRGSTRRACRPADLLGDFELGRLPRVNDRLASGVWDQAAGP